MTKVIVLNETEAYVSDVTSITDVLTTGLYIKEVPTIVTGFDSAVHTLALVTAAADVKTLDIVYAFEGYALWKVYQHQEGQPEEDMGYVAVIITATGTVASIDDDNALGTAEITNEEIGSGLLDYFASAPKEQYTDPDDISDAITDVKTKLRIKVEE